MTKQQLETWLKQKVGSISVIRNEWVEYLAENWDSLPNESTVLNELDEADIEAKAATLVKLEAQVAELKKDPQVVNLSKTLN